MATDTKTESTAAPAGPETTPLPPPGRAPASVSGGDQADRFIRGLTAFADSYIGLLTALRKARGRTEARQPGPFVPQWRTLVVAKRTDECDGVVSLRLAAPGGGPLPAWLPGAHLQVELPSGKMRHYSLCGDYRDRGTYRIAVRRIEGGGGGSAELHDTVRPGTELRVLGPRNGFPFAADPAVLFIAGGIGITPVLPMTRRAAELGLDWRLVYAGRSRATMPFLAEVATLDASRVTVLTDDETGVPDGSELIRHAPAGAAVYACGPPPMLAAARGAADAVTASTALGTVVSVSPAAAVPVRAFHFERFTAPPIEDGHPFEVELKSSGTVLTVPADRSVLDVLRARNPATPYSCQQGFCGTCRLRVVSGSVDHRDQRLTDSERAAGDTLVCVSRAPEGERLVLDL
jgi:ferredoxin-NADP reductase